MKAQKTKMAMRCGAGRGGRGGAVQYAMLRCAGAVSFLCSLVLIDLRHSLGATRVNKAPDPPGVYRSAGDAPSRRELAPMPAEKVNNAAEETEDETTVSVSQ